MLRITIVEKPSSAAVIVMFWKLRPGTSPEIGFTKNGGSITMWGRTTDSGGPVMAEVVGPVEPRARAQETHPQHEVVASRQVVDRHDLQQAAVRARCHL